MDVSPELTDQLLRHISSSVYRPSKPKHIATALKLDSDGYRELRRVVKQLVIEGRVVYGSNHLVIPAGAFEGGSDFVRGTFRRAMGGGFGFVRPGEHDDDSEIAEHLFVPPGSTHGALEGDVVEVKLQPSRKGGQEAVVVKILQRARRQFTGTFRLIKGEPAVFLDGTPYSQPVSIGDVRGLPLSDDDKVFVEMVEFPDDDGHGGEAVLLERLGSSTNPAIDTLTIMRQYGLPDNFPENVLNGARQQADAFNDEVVPEGRKDLTKLLTITIDPFDARDFDDAISLEREEGRWRLWVHIADVSSFIPEGSVLDEEAKNRATSVYLPDRVVPMIPEIISNHLASLQPDRVRLTKTVEIEMLDDLTITHIEVHNAAILSDKRFAYEQVDKFLADPDAQREPWGDAICDLLLRMHKLAMQMRKARFKGGSLSLDMPDVKLDFDKSGKVRGAHLSENTESHQIIEEFMLAGNQAVASWLDDLELNFLHRIHEPPQRRKIRDLQVFVRDLGLNVDSLESRFEIQRVLDLVAGTPLEQAVNFSVLKSMNKAVYGPQREGHYALDMEHYCHFTSPIRRYPDLSVHRLVQKLLDGQKSPDESFQALLRLGHHCSDMERNAQQAERDLIELKLLHFLKKKVGEKLDAVVSRVFADGIHARCIKLPVDGFLPVAALPNDKYRFERQGQQLVGFRDGNRFRLGDLLTVQIAKIDLQERQLFFDLVKNHSSEPGPVSSGRPKHSKERVGTKRKNEARQKKKGRKR